MIITPYDLDYPKYCYPDSLLSEHFIRHVPHLTSSLFYKNFCQRSTMLLTKEWYNFANNSRDCCCMMVYASWMDAKCVTLRRAWKKLANYIKDTIKAEVKYNITTDMEEPLSISNRVIVTTPTLWYRMTHIEWFQCDESSSIDHDTNVMLSYACYALMCASNNELKHEYNSNDDIPQRFEVLQSPKIELK